MRLFQVRVASLEWQIHILTCFFSLVQQTLPALNALSLGTLSFPLVAEWVITASSEWVITASSSQIVSVT